MRLGLLAGHFGPDIRIDYDLVLEAERLGYDSVWTSEAYGCDAIVPLAFIAAKTTRIGLGTAIIQMPARTPAMAAMTAMTLDRLSGGRFRLGIGASGPQVVEALREAERALCDEDPSFRLSLEWLAWVSSDEAGPVAKLLRERALDCLPTRGRP